MQPFCELVGSQYLKFDILNFSIACDFFSNPLEVTTLLDANISSISIICKNYKYNGSNFKERNIYISNIKEVLENLY